MGRDGSFGHGGSFVLGGPRSRSFRAVLDALIVLTIGAAFRGLGDADVLFHIVWTVLVVHAFSSSTLRPVIIRTLLATTCLLSYWYLPLFVGRAPMDIAEWPLMLLMLVIVAVMAERHRSTAVRYSSMFSLASDRLVTAQETERTHLARELHDGVGQSLVSLGMTLESAQRDMAPGTSGAAKLQSARELVAAAADETRVVARRMQPAKLAQHGLSAALQELAMVPTMPVGMQVTAEAVNAMGMLSAETQLHVYRIMQEVLANAHRHGGAERVDLVISATAGAVELNAVDDGCGFDLSVPNDRGLGLRGMRDRAAAIGGELALWSEREIGTTVRLTVPLPRLPLQLTDADAVGVQVIR